MRAAARHGAVHHVPTQVQPASRPCRPLGAPPLQLRLAHTAAALRLGNTAAWPLPPPPPPAARRHAARRGAPCVLPQPLRMLRPSSIRQRWVFLLSVKSRRAARAHLGARTHLPLAGSFSVCGGWDAPCLWPHSGHGGAHHACRGFLWARILVELATACCCSGAAAARRRPQRCLLLSQPTQHPCLRRARV